MRRRPGRTAVVSEPPLSVERLRLHSARDPYMHWRGVGLTACVGAFDFVTGVREAGTSASAAPRLLTEMPSGDALRLSDRSDRPRRVLSGFFEAGGSEVVVLDDSRFAAAGHWIGEDGGPGKRTGVFQLLDVHEVSTLLVVGAGDGERRERVLDAARRRPDKFFLFPAEAGADVRVGSRQRVTFLLPNAAEVRAAPEDPASGSGSILPAITVSRGAGPLDAARDLGQLAATLHATDFSDRPRFQRRPVRTPWPPRSPEVLPLMAWRRWEGLRRSIELGSRWAVMELHHPLVWRHVERDIRGFLHRMAEYGLIRRPGAGGYRVRCVPRRARASTPGGSVVPAIDIQVSVRLKAPYDAALGAIDAPASELEVKTHDRESSPGEGRKEAIEVEETPRDASRGRDPGGSEAGGRESGGSEAGGEGSGGREGGGVYS